jgi:hypothetical protein
MKKVFSIFIVGFLSGLLVSTLWPRPPKWDSNALLLRSLQRKCVLPTEADKKRFNLAAEVLESEGGLWLDIGAEKFLAHGVSKGENGERVKVCAPDGIYERVSEAITSRKLFGGKLSEYQLLLSSKIRKPTPYIIDSVAKVAFSSNYYISNNKDMRPLARGTLASYGSLASEYSTIAFNSMSSDSALGTSAAQLAIATGHPNAIQRTKELMEDILATGKPISEKEKKRFIELAYGLLYSPVSTQSLSPTIQKFMNSDFSRWVIPPVGMCDVLISINDGDSKVVSNVRACRDSGHK